MTRPKRTPSTPGHEEESNDTAMKKSIDKLQNDVSQILQNQVTLERALTLIEEMKKELSEKDKHISELEDRVDHLEQYSRLENVIISNLKTKPTSFASSVKKGTPNDNDELDQKEEISMEKQVVDFFEAHDIPISSNDIAACHPIGKKPIKDIIVRCVSRKSKNTIMRKVKKDKVLNGTDFYINEHLTSKNQELAATCRQLRKKKIISSTWVRDGKVHLKTKAETAEQERIYIIKRKQQLTDLGFDISNVFKKS